MTTALDLRCTRADDARIAEAHANVFRDWPHAATPEEHLRHRLASRHHQRATYHVGLLGDEVVCGLAVFPLTLFGPGGERPAGGIGAVHTREDHRGRGFASRLVRSAMQDEADRGVHDHLLFSDIDPGFYERLGFVRLPSFEIDLDVGVDVEMDIEAGRLAGGSPVPGGASIPVLELPSPPVLALDSLGFRFGIARPPDYQAWLHAKYEGRLRAFRAASGTLIGTVKQGRFRLVETDLSQEPADFSIFAAALVSAARHAGCRRATSMWTARAPEPAAWQSHVRPRREEILMWASRRGAADPWAPEVAAEGFRVFGAEHF